MALRRELLNEKPQLKALGVEGLFRVFKLDAELSGVLLYAKTEDWEEKLRNAFGSRQIVFRYHFLASTEVEFEILSKSNDVTELVAAVQQAAIEGSIVTHVKAKAAKHGCLTEGLKAMPVQVSTARIQEAIVTKEVMVLIRPPTEPPTGHPSRSPTAYPTLHKPASTGLDFLVATFSFR